MELEYHRELKLAAADFLQKNGWRTFQEIALPNGRIPDIIAWRPGNHLIIAECKTSLTHCDVRSTFTKYGEFADGIYLVGSDTDITNVMIVPPILAFLDNQTQVGFLSVNHSRVTVVQGAKLLPLLAEYRTAIIKKLKEARAIA